MTIRDAGRMLRKLHHRSVLAVAFVLWVVGLGTVDLARQQSVAVGLHRAVGVPPPGSGKPTILLVVTDDQRFDALDAMPTLRSQLMRSGVAFSNAFVVNPLCCPSRATILTGQFSHTTGVYTNHNGPFGGFAAFRPSATIADVLRRAGYVTGYFGKYFNGYWGQTVPRGWTRWFATFGHGAYYDYRADDDGVLRWFGHRPQDYGTSVIRREAVRFIRSARPEQPLFMLVAPHAPHGPATPAPGDRGLFRELAPWRPPSWNEADLSDKPAFARRTPPISESRAAEIDLFRRRQYQTLAAVDRLLSRVIQVLADTGRLADSLIVFTSDNGYMWGEHRISGKDVPYEESIRVPFVVRYDRLIALPRVEAELVANVDIAPTLADAAGVSMPGAEGRSLIPLLAGNPVPWRKSLLIEHLRYGGPRAGYGGLTTPTYCMMRTKRYAYIHYGTGDIEFYDLRSDPFELLNLGQDPATEKVRVGLEARLRKACHPRPPGFAWR
jgi:arylsulfatase A-like enzyme